MLLDIGKQVEVSTQDLNTASRQLWEVLSPYLEYLENPDDLALVELAFEQMVASHGEQRRKSGDYYIIHPVAAAIILTQIKIDAKTLAACLLHDVPEDTDTSLADLAEKFDPEIVFLVEGVTKLSVIKYQGLERYAENLRKMFVAMSQDIRVVFIKMADRIHNLMTLKYVREDKQKRIALESIEIYAPIAERLGVGLFKSEIQDLAFGYVHPQDYKELISLSDIEIRKRQKKTRKIEKKLQDILTEAGVKNFDLQARAKRYYSIYQKLKQKDKTIEEVYDLIALRIIVPDLASCYHTLATVHQFFPALPNRIKDYIVKPKPNGYQSLHTVVKDPQSGLLFEIQIRTYEMHEYCEYGWAAHWRYKEGGKNSKFLDARNLKWIADLVELGHQEISQEEYLQKVKLDLFEDRIFVLTPKYDVINLPKGSTPLDFAYHIHDQIGAKASMAKVNGEVKKLSYILENGDLVEIQTSKNQKPHKSWLDWVKTRSAKKHIRYYLARSQE